MRIVEIDDFFHPSSGYQSNVLSKYFVKFGHDVTIVCGEMKKMPKYLTDFFQSKNIDEEDKKYTDETGVKIIRIPLIKYVSGRAIYTKKIFKVIDELNPDILFIHADDTVIAMQYLLKIHKKNYALIMDNHQCDLSSHNKFREVFRLIFRRVFTPIIKKYQFKIVRLVENDDYMLKHYDIPLELTPCITFASDTMLFHPDNNVRDKFREDNNISKDAFVVIYAGKLDEYKGGLLLSKVLQLEFDVGREIVFLVVGNVSGDYGKEVERNFANSKNRILRFPTQKYRDLVKFFQASDIAVFAKECSLTFFDVQACGLPVVSENNEINVDRCSHNNGLNFESSSIEDFRNKIIEFATMSKEDFSKASKAAVKFVFDNYNYETKAKEFEKIMIEEIVRQKKV